MTKKTVGVNVYGTQIRFANNTCIVAESNKDKRDITTAVHETSKKLKLKISTEKIYN